MYVSRKLKRKIPSYLKLPEFKFDPVRLIQDTEFFADRFSVLSVANVGLSASHQSFVKKISDVYYEVALTTYDQDTNKIQAASSTGEISRIKNLAETPHLDEWHYGLETEDFKKTYFYTCCKALNFKTYRVRLALLKAGGKVDWHIDYDPSYATRLIIPIITHADVYNLTRRDGQIEKVHMPADGSVWFINTGFEHSVENNSDHDRYALIISVDGNTYWDNYLASK